MQFLNVFGSFLNRIDVNCYRPTDLQSQGNESSNTWQLMSAVFTLPSFRRGRGLLLAAETPSMIDVEVQCETLT